MLTVELVYELNFSVKRSETHLSQMWLMMA